MKNEKRINCFECRYFYTTWEPAHPRGCKGYSFKTKSMPSMIVFQSSGSPCLKFAPKSE
ncbi:uracil-DNA glycosylase [Bacillus haikouensis]|uniref:uracil-DNA glycosylase n=1 Tax=Bacillus haikouensis TaxID=1510468 RepID=UPI00155450F6|nr:uracil-DNA glycosylase [Bacillus haikouensis]NQD64741.1 uracil-DNA glycosylase [Bacillus haikouensis]